MAWELLASTKLTSTSDTIDSGTITAKKFLNIQVHTISSGQVTANYRFNSDSGTNYSRRQSSNGSEGTGINQTLVLAGWGETGETTYVNSYVINIADEEKLVITHLIANGTNGSANVPNRREIVGKWTNTSDQITNVEVFNNDLGDFASDSELVVWGID